MAAMQPDSQPSRTAEGMALLRTLEQQLPEAERILIDPYAALFLQSRVMRTIGHSIFWAQIYQAIFNRFAPGAQTTLTTRARFVDDLACEQARAGLRQIVIMGAGFDTMALRRKDELRGLTIFEIDHPATQAIKRKVLSALSPTNVCYLPVDFESEKFSEKLLVNGFDPAKKTLISWLGVTYYLTETAVKETFTQLAALCSSGAQLVFDYIYASVINGVSTNSVGLRHARFIGYLGEPWLWGIEAKDLPTFLSRYGFALVRDYDAAALANKYNLQRPLMDYLQIAQCEKG